ncbi:P2X purinoceptor 7-like [Entelurus aequoreus]|uniref:P2X purinoceptor 7-like n=1 Tax=Entelurus aequoreus TaxID=161455 RepID=UPI002B1CE56C|nr:P2X purinoceptor 7-like [Entelurus aequoreus]
MMAARSESDSDRDSDDFSINLSEDERFVDEESASEGLVGSGSDSDREEAVRGIEPYRFEPDADEDGQEDAAAIDAGGAHDIDRLENTEWCTCQNCVNMETVAECVCCSEIEAVTRTMEEEGVKTCIIDHHGFPSVCLDEWVLQTAYYAYKQQYGVLQQQQNERRRHTAYRQFVRFCWGYLGKDIRVVLPACVVHKIRTTFPSMDYTGFQDVQ